MQFSQANVIKATPKPQNPMINEKYYTIDLIEQFLSSLEELFDQTESWLSTTGSIALVVHVEVRWEFQIGNSIVD